MYVILVYDISEERVGKVCKFCRRYINWVQNSVFEGELTEARFARLTSGIKKVIDEDVDSVLIYRLRDERLVSREVMGVEKAQTDNIF